MSVRSVRLTTAQVAAKHDVSERTVRRWVAAGLPTLEPGLQGKSAPIFDAKAVDSWVESQADQETDLLSALCAKADAKARAAARILARLERECLPVADVEREGAALVADVRKRCSRVPAELAAAVEGLDVAGVEVELTRHGRSLLTDLAKDGDLDAGLKALKPRPIARSSTLRLARAQQAVLETAVLDAKEALAAGVLVSAEAVEKSWNGRVVAFRALLLSWPQTVADRLHRAQIAEGGVGARRVIGDALGAALAELEPRGGAPAKAPAKARRRQ